MVEDFETAQRRAPREVWTTPKSVKVASRGRFDGPRGLRSGHAGCSSGMQTWWRSKWIGSDICCARPFAPLTTQHNSCTTTLLCLCPKQRVSVHVRFLFESTFNNSSLDSFFGFSPQSLRRWTFEMRSLTIHVGFREKVLRPTTDCGELVDGVRYTVHFAFQHTLVPLLFHFFY